MRVSHWGVIGDIPLLADFNGGGVMELVIYRPSAGLWFVLYSGGAATFQSWGGAPGDIPVVGDWNGDSRADPAIFRPSTGQWWIFQQDSPIVLTWGAPGDVPLSGDQDGDGRSDYVLWRPSTGVWYSFLSSGGVAAVQWGTSGDKPVRRVPAS